MATSTFTQLLNSELVLTPVYTINPSTCPKIPGGRISQCVNEMGKKKWFELQNCAMQRREKTTTRN